LDDLESQRRSFAFESTLSSHALAKRLARLQQHGYRVHIVYLMSDSQPTIDELFEDGRAIDEALKEAARDARRFHKAMRNPMATWIDGQVAWVQPDDIVVDDEPAPSASTGDH
jgi:hypothetical protein